MTIPSSVLIPALLSFLSAPEPGASHQSTPRFERPRARSLFTPAGPSFDAARRADGTVVRQRAVFVDPTPLAWSHPGDLVRLDLFPDVHVSGTVERTGRSAAWTFTWSGNLIGELGTFSLAVNGDVLIGNVQSVEHGSFAIRYVGDGLHVIQAIDPARLPQCGVDAANEELLTVTGRVLRQQEDPICASDDANGAQIDVLVAYTPQARSAEGGTLAMQALIDLAVVETNTAYALSGVHQRLNLVHTHEVTYNETGSYVDHLYYLRDPSDGVMDEIHGLRDSHGADFVTLIVTDGAYCGVGFLMRDPIEQGDAAFPFNVVTNICATGYYSFGHELGHNMGIHHDRDNAGPAFFSYSYGWRFLGASGSQWRTVMAYSPGTRIQRFSNPARNFDRRPLGVIGTAANGANNAATLNCTAEYVSTFR